MWATELHMALDDMTINDDMAKNRVELYMQRLKPKNPNI
jgi:hypothetical protein